MTIRVFGVAADELVREGVLAAIDGQSDMRVVGQATGTPSSLPAMVEARPDIIMVDAHLARQRGLDACAAIRGACPMVPCVLMASITDERTLVEAAVAGAATVVPKQLRGTTMVDSIRAVAGGARLFDFPVNRQALDRLSDSFVTEPPAPLRRLLELMSIGQSREELARELRWDGPRPDALVDDLLRHVGLHPRDYRH